MENAIWRWPVSGPQAVAGTAGPLTFVGGAGDFDAGGRIRHPDDLDAQIPGTMANIAAALAVEGCGLADILRLKLFYKGEGSRDEWEVLAAIARHLERDPLPAITLHPVPLQPFKGQALQAQAIAMRGWRDHAPDLRIVTGEVPQRHRQRFNGRRITLGLRANEFIAVPARTAVDEEGNPLPGDGVAHSRIIMSRHEETLKALGASFQDAIKMEGYYFGITMEDWAEMARTRASFFREPGPVATVVPCHGLWPKGALTKIEVLGMRESWNGFDKYIPREDRWPRRVWDWSIPLPYRQAIRLRDMIWLGGQVPSAPDSNKGVTVLPGQLLPQTQFTMSLIDDLLRAFDRVTSDLRLIIAYFTSGGSEAETMAFLDTLRACIPGPLPPLTLVPQPHMHTKDMLVEIWGVAKGR